MHLKARPYTAWMGVKGVCECKVAGRGGSGGWVRDERFDKKSVVSSHGGDCGGEYRGWAASQIDVGLHILCGVILHEDDF